MGLADVKATILQEKIITIVRGDLHSQIEIIAHVLAEKEINVIEVTMNSPGVIDMIESLSAMFGDSMQIGAGTVLTPEQVDEAHAAGAKFIVSPDTYAPVIERALHHDMLPIPGAFTATEVRTAMRAGAELIKLFPAMPAGPDHVRQIMLPLGDAKLIPTGGVNANNIPDFLKAGAVAFGIGRSLVSNEFDGSASAQFDLRHRAEALKTVISSAGS